jgi:hypothetical protein
MLLSSADVPSRRSHRSAGPVLLEHQSWTGACLDVPEWAERTCAPELLSELSVLVAVYPDTVAVTPPAATADPTTADPFTTVARVAARFDGANVLVTLLVDIPLGYPTVDGCFPTFQVRSSNAARVVVASVQDELDVDVRQHCALGAFSLLTTIGRASEMVAGIPLGLQSDLFGHCVRCNQNEAKQAAAAAAAAQAAGEMPQGADMAAIRGKKFPRPLRVVKPEEEGTAPNECVPGDKLREPAVHQCITCGNTDGVVFVPALRPNVDGSECSYCFFDDNPLIHLDCNCLACFTCFTSFTSLATGSRQLRRSVRGSWIGVACPNHPTGVITEPPLYKLCDAPSFLRFNVFAMRKCAEELNGFECYNPRCCGLPTITNISGTKQQCAYCKSWSCSACRSLIIECRCPDWPASTPRDHAIASTSMLLANNSRTVSLNQLTRRQIRILAVVGTHRCPVTLDTSDRHWAARLRHQLQVADTPVIGEKPFTGIFHGVPLSQANPLGVIPIYDGAIVYVIVHLLLFEHKTLDSERDLFSFRRHIDELRNAEADPNKKPAAPAAMTTNGVKHCKACNVPVLHYHNHGCHHIGFARSTCCGHHWCYVCRGPYPCKSCPLMCNEFCGCPPCPDCKPMMPCAHCWGCKQCKGTAPDELLQ